jgi:hypothetical protein
MISSPVRVLPLASGSETTLWERAARRYRMPCGVRDEPAFKAGPRFALRKTPPEFLGRRVPAG